MNIIDAIQDPKLFRPFLGESLDSWQQWMVALRTLYGLPVSKADKGLVKLCTGRKRKALPTDGFDTALFLTGRRSGKSRIAAVVGAFEAALSGRHNRLAAGERGVVPIIAPSKNQSAIVKDYLRAIFDQPLFRNEVTRETKEGFDLKNNVSIQVLAGDWRTVRGFTLIAAVVDECCFFGLEAESKIKSDTSLVRAIKPGLASTQGKLIAISSPYAKRGWAYSQFKKHFGDDSSKVLVWNCSSRTMNSTLPESIVKDALLEDAASAKAEYLGQFRDDVSDFVPRQAVEARVVRDRTELLPKEGITYTGFVDPSGGRSDDMTLAIAHKESRRVVLDFVRVWKPPINPMRAINEMAKELKRFGIRHVTGDNYAAEFVSSSFKEFGIHYRKSSKNKSELYLELLPRLCSDEVELLDNERMIEQLSSLERRTRSGGRDIIDHPQGAKDDLANAVAGAVCHAAFNRHIKVGVI